MIPVIKKQTCLCIYLYTLSDLFQPASEEPKEEAAIQEEPKVAEEEAGAQKNEPEAEAEEMEAKGDEEPKEDKPKTEKKGDDAKGSKRLKTIQCKVTLLDGTQYECQLEVSHRNK